MIKVKYSIQFSHDGYSYMTFYSYEEYGKWHIENYRNVIIWDIEVM